MAIYTIHTGRKLNISLEAENIVATIENFGGCNISDSGHNDVSKAGINTTTSLVFNFPESWVKIAIELKVKSPHLFIYEKNSNGDCLKTLFPIIEKLYTDADVFPQPDPSGTGDLGRHSGVSVMQPTEDKRVLRLKSFGDADLLKEILLAFNLSSSSSSSSKKSGKEMSPEDLLKKLERQDAIGIKGEDFAIEYKKKRLEKLGADLSKIDEYIIDSRKINVSQGYDIESHFGGQSRYIEVKTTTVNAEADFFFSTNEFNVLKAKGEKAYIYRVVLSEDLESIVEIREIQNPFGAKDTSDFKAIAFKASLKDFEN